MQLRAHTRLPGRYREDDIPPPPGTAKFVHPTTPYNPNLPPAAFPTLDVPRPVAPPPAEAMDVDGSEGSNSPFEEEPLQRPAAVFRVKEKASITSSSELVLHAAEEKAERQEPENCLRQPQPSVPSEDPGSFELNGLNLDDEVQDKNARVGMPAYELLDDWKHINNGLKLVILSEMMKNLSFKDVIEILILSSEEIEEIYDLHEKEALRQAEENIKIGQAQARQLETLMRGAFATNRDRISALFADDVYATFKPPDMFVFSKNDVQQAQRFLSNLKLFEYSDRLWRYHGIAMVPNLVCMHTAGPSSLFWSSGCPADRLHLQALQPGPSRNTSVQQPDFRTASSRKRKQPPSNGKGLLSNSRGRKRPRTRSRLIKMKVPASSLRNMITAENQDAGTNSAFLALHELSPIQHPAPFSTRSSEASKGSGSPQVRFKPLSNKSSPSTSPLRQVTAFVTPALTLNDDHSPWSRSLAAENQINNWLPSSIDLCPPPLAATSVAPATQPTSMQTESQLSSSETQIEQFKSPSVRVSPAKVDVTPSNSMWLRVTPPGAQSTNSGPPESPQGLKPPETTKPQLSFGEALPTTPRCVEQQMPRPESQLILLESLIPQVSPVEADVILPESSQPETTLVEPALTLSERLPLNLSPEEAHFTPFESPQQQSFPFKADFPHSKTPELPISPVRPQLTSSKPPENQLSSAKKRFALVAKRLGKTALLPALNGIPIELITPPKAPHVGASPEILPGKTQSAQENAQIGEVVLTDHVVSPASPDPLTGEVQTRKTAKKLKTAFPMKILGKASLGNFETTTEEPVTPTKKPTRVEATQKRSKPFKSMNVITKEEVTTKATPLKIKKQVPAAAVTYATANAGDKDMRTKATIAKLKGAELVAQMSQSKTMIDKALPNEIKLPNRKRKQLHHPDDVQDL